MPLPIRLILKEASLHTKMMLTLAIFITLAVAFVASILIEHERKTRYIELEERADRMADMASHSMAYSVWNVDLIAIDEQLASLASDPEVVQCIITAVGYGKLREVIKPMEAPLVEPIERIQTINFATAETGSQKIGEVRVVLTRALVEQAIIEAHRTVWVLIVVTLAVLYVATYFLLRRVVSAPVNRLEAMVDQIALGDLDARCFVESGDELGRLAARVNTMAERLRESDRSVRDSEKRLQLVLDGSQLGYWDWNIETGKVIRNARWAEMIGYTPDEVETTVKQWTDLHHPDDRTRVMKSINDHLEGRTPAHDVEYRMRTKDGRYKWILDQARLVSWDAQGKPLRMCGTQKDITERKLAEQEREKLQNQLTQAQKMESIGTLAGGIAHDFNNILAAILGYAEMAREDVPTDSRVAKDLDQVLDGGNRAKDLVQQILAFSRQDDMEKTPLRPAGIIQEAIKMLRSSLPATIEITQDITSATGLILAGSTQIHQIVMNLCTNAFHAMEETGGKLDISLKEVTLTTDDLVHEPSAEPGTFVQLSISDSGPGIAPDIKKKIFDPYFTTKKTGKGTGMGLAIVHGIVKSCGGFISFYSELGEGTAFHIFIPVIKQELLPDIQDEEPIPSGRERIIFIDDEEILAEMGKNMLERLGYHVTVQNNSIEALETFQNTPDLFDLVITDQTMPGLTGADMARRMIQIRPDIPIILCTGYSTVTLEEKTKSIGIKEFASKPISKRDIAVLIRKVLDNQ